MDLTRTPDLGFSYHICSLMLLDLIMHPHYNNSTQAWRVIPRPMTISRQTLCENFSSEIRQAWLQSANSSLDTHSTETYQKSH